MRKSCAKNVNSLRTDSWQAVDVHPQKVMNCHTNLRTAVYKLVVLLISPTVSTDAFPQRKFADYLSKITAYPHFPQHLLLSLQFKN